MDNKVLITLYVPSFEQQYDLYIPVNKRIYVIIDVIKKALFELNGGNFKVNDNYSLYNYETGVEYQLNELVRDTDIRNDSKLIFV